MTIVGGAVGGVLSAFGILAIRRVWHRLTIRRKFEVWIDPGEPSSSRSEWKTRPQVVGRSHIDTAAVFYVRCTLVRRHQAAKDRGAIDLPTDSTQPFKVKPLHPFNIQIATSVLRDGYDQPSLCKVFVLVEGLGRVYLRSRHVAALNAELRAYYERTLTPND